MERLQFDWNSVYELDEECIREKDNINKENRNKDKNGNEEVNYFTILFCLKNI